MNSANSASVKFADFALSLNDVMRGESVGIALVNASSVVTDSRLSESDSSVFGSRSKFAVRNSVDCVERSMSYTRSLNTRSFEGIVLSFFESSKRFEHPLRESLNVVMYWWSFGRFIMRKRERQSFWL